MAARYIHRSSVRGDIAAKVSVLKHDMPSSWTVEDGHYPIHRSVVEVHTAIVYPSETAFF